MVKANLARKATGNFPIGEEHPKNCPAIEISDN